MGSKPIRIWFAVAVLLVAGGVFGAAFAARSVAHDDAERSRQGFEHSSGEITSSLKLAIQHQEDLVISTSGFVTEERRPSVSEFASWLSRIRAFSRYPELTGIGYAIVVRPSELSKFGAKAIADPVGPLAADGSFQVLPPGRRAYYCLGVAGQARGATVSAFPAGFDYCYRDGGNAIKSRDTGQASYIPRSGAGDETLLSINTPVFSRKATTVRERRRSFSGFVGNTIKPNSFLDRSLNGHPDMSVALRFRNSISRVSFSRGKTHADAQSRSVRFSEGWTVTTSAPAVSDGVFSSQSGLAVLVGGIMLSMLLGAVFFAMATSRLRALRLVEQKTYELNHLATHDVLTGLPNRGLVMDRATQMLTRTQRHPGPIAALFVDIDRFKQINDTLGHAAGDRLLTVVAERLQSVIRDEDTVGRLGGDEFVVLIESSPPDLVAERLIEILREPIEIDGNPVSISASVGVATGFRSTAGELLRDADLALYAAKKAGKDRYIVFDPSTKPCDDASQLRRSRLKPLPEL